MEEIKTVLDKVLRNLDIERKKEEGEIWQNWREWIGEDVGRHTQPQSLNYGKLVVNVDSSVWVEQLTKFRKEEILKELNRRLGKDLIKEIHFRVGEIK
ncbi:DUF721 domain-containing protein [bacterium]|nr:DUF721 domain-containing protein [bacterium]MCK4326197.1 DUF721 domain-containing protein [bacterium]MCK4436353.1 DUF721 domain-containing protein [bacterium]